MRGAVVIFFFNITEWRVERHEISKELETHRMR